MAFLKIVLLIESDPFNEDVHLPYKCYRQKLWTTIETIVSELNYCYETVELNKLDFQEYESVNKFLNANIVIMDVANQDHRPTFMYHKGNRDSIDCMDDIVLIQASNIENDNAIQDLKTICKIKHLIEYRYNEQQDVFYDISTNPSSLLKKNLKFLLNQAANNMQERLSNRYFNLLEERKNLNQDANAARDYLWEKICDEILTEINQKYATSKLITQLMYAFRDIQDYQSMIELIERCTQYEIISKQIQNNMRILYLTAFARSRRNENDDRDKALEILEILCQTKKIENELSNDITCLCGTIYKDKYIESNCKDKNSLEKAIEWYQKDFAANPNIPVGINLLFCLAITTDDFKKNNEAFKIIIQLNALLGKKARSLKDLNDYSDVATYFELHAIQRDWVKACQAAFHMYLLNPPIWYLKSTIDNLKILHKATCLRDQERLREQSQLITTDENVYNFWIDFFSDAINSNSTSAEERELSAQVPILVCNNNKKTDGTIFHLQAYLQLNFHTDSEPETLVIRMLEQQKQVHIGDLIKTIEMNSIRSIINITRDNRSIFLYAYDNSETFSFVELQIYFSSAEQRIKFNEKMSKYRVETNIPKANPELDLEFDRDRQGQRIALGQGTFKKVYVAHDRITWKKFAVKEISIRNPHYIGHLENEIKILSTLNHKNIVSYYGTAIDSKKKPSIFQIIMEYVDVASLSKHLSVFGQFSEASIRNYTRQLLEGVQYLHENHIVHRDINPSNILLNSKGEIKIVGFGTSKRLAGLHLCTEERIGTLRYMCPEVVVVPPMGYGSEVDIWSVGCTVIEMATDKRPFHNIVNPLALVYKLGTDKQPPEIPSELSDAGKDFLSKCFETPNKRPFAKDLLNHPFLKTKIGLTRETSSSHIGDRIEGSSIRLSDSSSSLQRNTSEDGSMFYEPTPILELHVSIDDHRRSILANILRHKECRQTLIGEWMSLIEEKCETELLTIEKLLILLSGICDYLDSGNSDSLEHALDQICDRTKIDSRLRIDLERSFYLLTKAANIILSSRNILPPHILFALDNLIRRIAEHFVGLIRPDFRSAVNNTIPSTLGNGSQSHIASTNNTEENQEQFHRKLEINNEIKSTELINNEQNSLSRMSNLVGLPYNAQCEFCSTSFTDRSLYEKHSQICSKAIVTCLFKNVGCHIQVPQEALYDHVVSSLEEHLQLLADFSSSIPHQSMSTRPQSLSSSAVNPDIKSLQNEIARQGRIIEQLCLEQKNVRLEQNNLCLEQKNFQSMLMKREQELARACVGVQLCKGELCELKKEVQLTTTLVNNDGTYLWRITNVHELFRNAKNSSEPSYLTSPPFYTSKYGYKLSLRLYLNGDKAVRDTYLSLYITVMYGDYDSLLKWPFSYPITLCLYDRSSKHDHVVHTLTPDITSVCFERPRMMANKSGGIPEFCPLWKIFSKEFGYVRQDEMFIKAFVDFNIYPTNIWPQWTQLQSHGLSTHVEHIKLKELIDNGK